MNKVIEQKTLMIGSSSFLGRYLSDLFDQNLVKTYYSNKIKNGIKFDIATDDIKIIMNRHNITQVLLIGGVVNFTEIKKNINYSKSINITNMKRIIREIVSYGAKVIFFSSESVFDGNTGNYSESSNPSPKFIYGEHKFQIEKYIQEITNDYIIFRISKVYSSNPREKTLITNWLDQLGNNETLLVAKDNILSPIYIKDCVLIIKTIISKNETGIFNVCSNEQLSRLDILKLLIYEYQKNYHFSGRIKITKLHDIKGAEQLPLNTSLNYSKTYSLTKINPIAIKDIIREIINNYFEQSKNHKRDC